MTSPLAVADRPASKTGWPVPAALIALSVIPLTAGTFRLVQLAGGPEVTPVDDRFTGFPTPLVHIVRRPSGRRRSRPATPRGVLP